MLVLPYVHYISFHSLLSIYAAVSLHGKRVIELGTGAGLVSVVSYLGGAFETVATDGDAELLDLTRENISLNCSAVKDEGGLRTIYATPLLW